jgi:GNAT superfamily N-acetyltransferase
MTASLHIVPLEDKHLEDAAALVCARYRALRQHAPLMPARYEAVAAILPLLHNLPGRAPGVAAIRGSRLVGFLGAFVLPRFQGQRSAYSPEWGNAADPAANAGDSRRIYEEMYTQVAARWVAAGCPTHLVGSMAHERDTLETWHWLGFGLCAADAVRDLTPVRGAAADVEIRRARLEDAKTMAALDLALHRHIAAAPTFLFDEEEGEELACHQKWLADPANALWLAYDGAEPVACMGQGPASPEACDLIADEGTTSIVTAFTQPRVRGQGIAVALLNRVLAWGQAEGYERCAVDFEPMNTLAARFWTRCFQLVCLYQMRYVGEPAREDKRP